MSTTKTPKHSINIIKLVSIKSKSVVSSVKGSLRSVLNRAKHPRKTSKKLTKLERETAKRQRKNAILGIGLLLVVVSIAYSTSVIYIGVDSEMSRIALLPQVVFGLITIFKAFSKLYR